MQMLDDMDRRLRNWAEVMLERTAGGGGVPTVDLQRPRVDCEARTGWDAPAVVPVSYAEAEVTHLGVQALPGALRAAVECWYLHPGGVRVRAARLAVSETTLRQRIGLAQRELSQWLADRAAAAQAERARVERLRAGVLRSVDLR